MTCDTDAGVSGYESAVEQFCTLVFERVANAEPGDALHNVTGSELVVAMEDGRYAPPPICACQQPASGLSQDPTTGPDTSG